MPMLATRGSASARSLAMDGPIRARRTFVYVSNALQTFTVPANVTTINIEVHGAAGGGSGGEDPYGTGPSGNRVTGRLTVTPGATLHIAAGRGGNGGPASAPTPFLGQNLGGWPGGGNAGNPTWNYYPSGFAQGGGGGGYSGIFSAGSLTQGNALVIAGAGGGSGGDAIWNGSSATVSAGGARGGEGQPNNSAQAGSALQGGQGDDNSYVNPSFSYPGGGGGGGYFGGGGGYSQENTQFNGWGGGGSGSSYTSASVVPANNEVGVHSGDGFVTLSW